MIWFAVVCWCMMAAFVVDLLGSCSSYLVTVGKQLLILSPPGALGVAKWFNSPGTLDEDMWISEFLFFSRRLSLVGVFFCF